LSQKFKNTKRVWQSKFPNEGQNVFIHDTQLGEITSQKQSLHLLIMFNLASKKPDRVGLSPSLMQAVPVSPGGTGYNFPGVLNLGAFVTTVPLEILIISNTC
jgi:hypothetical protein